MKFTVTNYLNVRIGKPSVNAPCHKFLSPGEELDVEETLYTGDLFEGINTWYKDQSNNYYWSGALNSLSADKKPIAIGESKDWGFLDFKIEELWELSKGAGINVAVLDSGLNYNLQDFVNNGSITYYNAVSNSDNKSDCFDNDASHGTNCAGILCGQGINLLGIAPEINLQVIKITNEKIERTGATTLLALQKAIDSNADIICMSYHLQEDDPDLQLVHNKIQEAHRKNIVLIAAAGNSGDFISNDFPASFEECLSIGGITRELKRSTSSAKSNFLKLMAPGENLIAISNPQKRIKGTSYSVPFVAGSIALLKSIARKQGKEITNAQLFDVLKQTATTTIPNYNSLEYGWGIINPIAAAKLI